MTPAPLFDDYLVVDWIAAAVPCRGADSIWYCHLARQRNGIARRRLANPATRHKALLELVALLAGRAGRGRRVLIGFDFANGYPAGLVAAAGGQPGDAAQRKRRGEVPWRGLWRGRIGKEIRDGPDNANNRFEVAAALNKRISGRAFPFWGCPAGRAGKYLTMRKPPFTTAAALANAGSANSGCRARKPAGNWPTTAPSALRP